MATTKANLLGNEFRRLAGDMYNPSTGAAITNIAAENGNEWSYTELADLIVQAINEYQLRVIGELKGDVAEIGRSLAAVLPEYMTRTALAVQLQGVPGYYVAASADVDLPSDYSWVSSVAVAENGAFAPGRYCDPAKFARIISGNYAELTGCYYTVEGSKIRVVSIHTGLYGQAPGGPVQSQVELVYVKTQPAVTLVTGAGGTDILLRPHHNAAILSLMKIIATRYKAQ